MNSLTVGALTSSTELYLCGSRNDNITQEDYSKIASTGYGSQVIVPKMRLNFSGYITSWSASTLILTHSNYLEQLTHTITFQVWRPSNPAESAMEYTLVGSNQMSFNFDGSPPGVINWKRIHVASGDIIGWYSPPQLASAMVPLTILYQSSSFHSSCSMYQYDFSTIPCALCFDHSARVKLTGSPSIFLSYGMLLQLTILCSACLM